VLKAELDGARRDFQRLVDFGCESFAHLRGPPSLIVGPASGGVQLLAYRDAPNGDCRPEAARAFFLRELVAAGVVALLKGFAPSLLCGSRARILHRLRSFLAIGVND